MSEVHPIRSDEDLKKALARVEVLWPKKENSQRAADELEVLTILIEEYERRTIPLRPPTPLEAIRFRMDQMGLNTTQLGELMGTTRARASEVLNGKRSLTLPMIRALVTTLGLDAEVLLAAPPSRGTARSSDPAPARL